ncbi:hypothetical protein LCGC14_2691520 [marine sediment metagenome]|uniref:Uncharacterized protein n=1 Tax=marine sediment metagenome TaxID=412755 RepID=A0A0F8ZIE1_9ZZZZ
MAKIDDRRQLGAVRQENTELRKALEQSKDYAEGLQKRLTVAEEAARKSGRLQKDLNGMKEQGERLTEMMQESKEQGERLTEMMQESKDEAEAAKLTLSMLRLDIQSAIDKT